MKTNDVTLEIENEENPGLAYLEDALKYALAQVDATQKRAAVLENEHLKLKLIVTRWNREVDQLRAFIAKVA